jgi:protein phosphatase
MSGRLPVVTDLKLPLNPYYLVEAIRLANNLLIKLNNKYYRSKGISTTICSLMFDNTAAYIAHVGDSRAYSFNGTKLTCITKDHSYAMSLLEDKEIDATDLIKFKDKNVITRALGTDTAVDIDLNTVPLTPEIKLFLLCTDGLWGVVGHSEIEKVCTDNIKTPGEICKQLITMANNLGGPDNITVGIVTVSDVPAIVHGTIIEEKTVNIRGIKDQKIPEYSKLLVRLVSESGPLIPKHVKQNYLKKLVLRLLIWVAAVSAIPLLLLFMNAGIRIFNPGTNNTGQSYSIKIDNYVPDTKIKLSKNGILLKETEFPVIDDLQPGIYQVQLTKTGFDEKTFTVTLVTNSVTVDGKIEILPKIILKLDLSVVIKESIYPADSYITVDDNKTDITIKNLRYGEITIPVTRGNHTIRISYDSSVYWEKTVTVNKERTEVIINSYEFKKR